MDVYIDRDSVGLVGIRINHHDLSGATLDPTGYTVTVALVPQGTRPAAGDYKAATWHTGTEGDHWAQLLLTTAVPVPVAGRRYDAYAKVAASPETPVVRSPDTIVIR